MLKRLLYSPTVKVKQTTIVYIISTTFHLTFKLSNSNLHGAPVQLIMQCIAVCSQNYIKHTILEISTFLCC